MQSAWQAWPGVGVVAFVVLSNHAHFLLVPGDAEQLARFMNYVNGNLAREAGRLHSWRERVWGRRYTAIVVSEEEEAQVGRRFWPGLSAGWSFTTADAAGRSATDVTSVAPAAHRCRRS